MIFMLTTPTYLYDAGQIILTLSQEMRHTYRRMPTNAYAFMEMPRWAFVS